MNACQHLEVANDDVIPKTPEGCEECLQSGDSWMELRLCLTCGHVGCCDNSKNKHATRHFKDTKHPVVQAFQSKDDWKWCYVDKIYDNK